jgi:hypothetical protein
MYILRHEFSYDEGFYILIYARLLLKLDFNFV